MKKGYVDTWLLNGPKYGYTFSVFNQERNLHVKLPFVFKTYTQAQVALDKVEAHYAKRRKSINNSVIERLIEQYVNSGRKPLGEA